MRNKELFENKLERMEMDTKKIGYHIRRMELEIAYDFIEVFLEKINDMKTLLNTETQD